MTDVVVVLGAETWDDCVRRGMHRPPDRFVQTLANDERVGRILVVNARRGWVSSLVPRLRDRGLPPDSPLGRPAGVEVHQPRILRCTGTTTPRAYRRLSNSIRRAVGAHGLRRPALVTFDTFLAAWGELTWARSVTWYARDDAASFPKYAAGAPVILDAYASIRDRGIGVVAVTHEIIERVGPRGPTRVVPNGVDPDEWERATAPPAWFLNLPGPRAVYAGTLDERLDVEALVHVAHALDGGTVVLMGPLVDDGLRDELAARHDNVVFTVAEGRRELVDVIRHADVCLVPHVDRAQTRAMSPLKLFEYLAGGRPVVCTDLPPMRGVHDHVVVSETSKGFHDATPRALEMGPMSEEERIRVARAHAWSTRHEPLVELVAGRIRDREEVR